MEYFFLFVHKATTNNEDSVDKNVINTFFSMKLEANISLLPALSLIVLVSPPPAVQFVI